MAKPSKSGSKTRGHDTHDCRSVPTGSYAQLYTQLRIKAGAPAGYHSYATLMADLSKLAAKHARVARFVSLSEIDPNLKTHEGRDIFGLRIGTNPAAFGRRPGRPSVVIVGCHHAREWVSIEVPYLLAEYILEPASLEKDRREQNRKEQDRMSKLIKACDIWILPLLNPDGLEFSNSAEENRLWRKNRRRNLDGTYGVDLNRNYGYEWSAKQGTTDDTSDDTYRGPEGFSEPETQGIEKLFKHIEKSTNRGVCGSISYHNFNDLIMYPWDYTKKKIEDEHRRKKFEALGKIIETAVNDATTAKLNKYTLEQGAELYTASGTMNDWAYRTYGTYSFTIELSPYAKFDFERGFRLPYADVRGVFEQNREGAIAFMESVFQAELAGVAP
jgi:carboxypeptidase T